MDKAALEKHKIKLLNLKARILSGGILKSKEDLSVSSDDLPDEADLANNVINQQVTFSMRQREFSKLRAIEDALHKIEEGQFGPCEECGEHIGKKRLEHQPWATLCITHAEEQEREQRRFTYAG